MNKETIIFIVLVIFFILLYLANKKWGIFDKREIVPGDPAPFCLKNNVFRCFNETAQRCDKCM